MDAFGIREITEAALQQGQLWLSVGRANVLNILSLPGKLEVIFLREFFWQRVVLNIFDVRSGKVMRDFKGTADEFGGIGGASGVPWPVFR